VEHRRQVPDRSVSFASTDVHVVGTSEALATVLDLEVLTDGRDWVLGAG